MAVRRKSVITLTMTIGADRRLVVDLPPDAPTGQIELHLVLRPIDLQPSIVANPARDRLCDKLKAAGMLRIPEIPENLIMPTDDEILQAGILPPGARRSEEIIREIRSDD